MGWFRKPRPRTQEKLVVSSALLVRADFLPSDDAVAG
jgi:hypothetical protein